MSIDLKSMLIGHTKGKKSGGSGGGSAVLGEFTVTENGVYDKPTINVGHGIITWDGVYSEDDAQFPMPEVYTLVKVSDIVPTVEDLTGAVLKDSNGNVEVILPDDIESYEGEILVRIDIVPWVVVRSGLDSEQDGLYFQTNAFNGDHVSSLTFADTPIPADGWNKVTVNVDSGIVDVESLPAENVDESKTYRVTETAESISEIYVYMSSIGTTLTMKNFACEYLGLPSNGEFVFHLVDSFANFDTNSMIAFGADGSNYHLYIDKNTGVTYARSPNGDTIDFMQTTAEFPPEQCVGFISDPNDLADREHDAYGYLRTEVVTHTIYGIPDNATVKRFVDGAWVELA